MPTKHSLASRSNPLQGTGARLHSSSTDSDSSDSLATLSDASTFVRSQGEHPKHSPNGSQKDAPLSRADIGESGSDQRSASQEDDRTRRKGKCQSQSESGTEADDESYSLVKALPPPPVKPRKGLRRSTEVVSDGGSTPLLSPSIIDEDAKKQCKGYFPTRDNVGRRSSTDNERRTGIEKLKRRRRAELMRRTLETILFGAVGFSVLCGAQKWELAWTCHQVELVSFVVVFSTLVFSYPLRLLVYLSRLAPTGGHQPRPHIRVPSAFDPATLLYPACLPVLVALSLLASNQKYLLANITLGLAALPPRLIPKFGQGHGYNALHWIITLIPTMASETMVPYFELVVQRNYMPKTRINIQLSPEILIYLYPLHQAMLSPLEYLTTTSLLPTELQLLSVSLINILLFSTSPQATILLSLLWIGGLALFVLCSHVVRWGVALARIPKLKFKQVGQSVRRKKPVMERIKGAVWRGICGRSSFSGQQECIESDADDTAESEETSINVLPHRGQPKLRTSSLPAPQPFVLARRDVQSAVDDTLQSELREAKQHNGVVKCPSVPPRSATMPSNGSISRPSLASTRSHKRTSFSSLQSYLQLTPTQASIRKWLYAIYLYFVILVIIFTAVRGVVGRYALNGKEPVGWALGYLLGNIPAFRYLVCFLRPENSWIPLPFEYATDSSTPHGLAERLRQNVIGAANTRLLLCAYYITIIAMGLVAVLRFPITEVDTRRKVFHGMMVAMFLPTTFIDPAFVALALSLVLAIFLLLELIRASQLPPLSRPLANFLQPYVDGRDLRGPVIASHIFLLVGCAIPLWLSLAGIERTGHPPWEGWDVETRDVSMVAGVVCVGMGDAAASLIGRRYGRRRWPWAGGKSLEGSLAFVVAVTVGLTAAKVWLTLGGWEQQGSTTHGSFTVLTMGKITLAACGASITEAVLTGANDNVLVPIILWLLVRGLGT